MGLSTLFCYWARFTTWSKGKIACRVYAKRAVCFVRGAWSGAPE
jgi:hypothetical protein